MRTRDWVDNTEKPTIVQTTLQKDYFSTPVEQTHFQPQSLALNPFADPFISTIDAPMYADHIPTAMNETLPSVLVEMGDKLAKATDAIDKTLQLQQEHNKRGMLPPIKLPRFNGKITEYISFRESFKYNVDNNTDDLRIRLTILYGQLDGPPKDLLEGCLELPSEVGYTAAWELLSNRYGNSYDLIDKYLETLNDWKNIESADVDEMDRYGAYLFKIKCSLKNEISRLEFKETINRIVSKLPHYLRTKWADKAVDRSTGTRRGFSFLVDFVNAEAKKARERRDIEDLVRKSSRKINYEKSAAGTPLSKERTMAIHATSPVSYETKLQCYHCNKNSHEIVACIKFQRLSANEKWNYITSRRPALCFRCLKPNHRHDRCPEKTVCSHCGASSHHSLLHKPLREDAPTVRESGSELEHRRREPMTTPTEPTGADSANPGIPSHISIESPLPVDVISSPEPDGSVMLKIIPVNVTNQVSTYAFIDGGAAPTLASRSLIDKLGIKGRPCRQVMRTECGDFVCDEVVTLSIAGLDGGEELLLEDVFVTGKLSVTTDHLMPITWMKNWTHLKDVTLLRLPSEHNDVELIVGLKSILNRHILD